MKIVSIDILYKLNRISVKIMHVSNEYYIDELISNFPYNISRNPSVR